MNMIAYGLIFAGIASISLGMLHIPRVWGAVFPQWQAEINSLTLLTRKLVTTILVAFCLALVALGLMTLLLAGSVSRLDSLQVWFLVLCLLFWVWRLLWQVFYFPYRKLQPGPRLLSLHLALIVIFAVNAIAYAAPVFAAFMNLGN